MHSTLRFNFNNPPSALTVRSRNSNSGNNSNSDSNSNSNSAMFAADEPVDGQEQQQSRQQQSRRSVLTKTAQSLVASYAALDVINQNVNPNNNMASAAVGTIPELADTNAVLQGLTIDVADTAQQDSMINFLQDGFGFKKLRQRKVATVTDTWLAFGPEEMNVPSDFELPVSSFAKYGGHASIHIRCDTQSPDLFYRAGDAAPGDNIAYLQVGVPEYRISQMVKNGGNILDAYGIVNVVSPSGLPMRGVVGISPDPIMFVALKCQDVKTSRTFYEQLGFAEQEYPYCRPNKGMGQFEPVQPKNSVYLAPAKNSMGVLLLQAEKRRKAVKPNPILRSLNIVYQPSDGTVIDASANQMKVVDPSMVSIAFEPLELFEKMEMNTRLISQEDVETSNLDASDLENAVKK